MNSSRWQRQGPESGWGHRPKPELPGELGLWWSQLIGVFTSLMVAFWSRGTVSFRQNYWQNLEIVWLFVWFHFCGSRIEPRVFVLSFIPALRKFFVLRQDLAKSLNCPGGAQTAVLLPQPPSELCSWHEISGPHTMKSEEINDKTKWKI